MPFKLSWRSTAKHYLDYDYISSNPDEITEKVTQFYLGDKSPMAGTAFEYSDVRTTFFTQDYNITYSKQLVEN